MADEWVPPSAWQQRIHDLFGTGPIPAGGPGENAMDWLDPQMQQGIRDMGIPGPEWLGFGYEHNVAAGYPPQMGPWPAQLPGEGLPYLPTGRVVPQSQYPNPFEWSPQGRDVGVTRDLYGREFPAMRLAGQTGKSPLPSVESNPEAWQGLLNAVRNPEMASAQVPESAAGLIGDASKAGFFARNAPGALNLAKGFGVRAGIPMAGQMLAQYGPQLAHNMPGPSWLTDAVSGFSTGAGYGAQGFMLGPEVGIPTTIAGATIGAGHGLLDKGLDLFMGWSH